MTVAISLDTSSFVRIGAANYAETSWVMVNEF